MAEAVAYGVIAGLVTALISCVAAALVCTFSSDPDKLTAPLSTAACILAHFVAGVVSAKKKNAALPAGLASGGCLALIFWMISLCFGESYSYGMGVAVTVLIRLSMVAVSLFAALLGVNAGGRKRRRRR